jgi:hypothetical protein|uniref:Uncharacterized protein n=1 Tax=Microviridae sp. ctrJ69 TaxID=2825007 RepID=A0A8S5UL17_9VIRU|nr:MAG TPA: hypothetical protein [Microviridae sp. ctrJ69]
MSILDKLTFIKQLLPTLIKIFEVIIKCLEVILGAGSENATSK